MAVAKLAEDAIFNIARKIDAPEARADYLRQVCGPDAALRGRIDALLQVHEQEKSFLQTNSTAVNSAPMFAELPGAVIGPYKLLEQIGEGGFGVVFMAEQTEPMRRKVALKILKPGMDTRQVVARFEAERQALALMDHPNIAKVFDGGMTGVRSQESGVRNQESRSASLTPDAGRPYFVMELVRGVPLTQYCDEQKLSPRQRLELFIPVCQAVQHAHQKGIIHRDLKPSNILVVVHDTTPVPKVIDFGIAKATGRPLIDKTLFTSFVQLMGTPMYMSPEQAHLSGLDIDTRSDIYSLGVLLYELLTGTTPFDQERLRTAAYDEILRIIREEEPPKPSTRLSTLRHSKSGIRNGKGTPNFEFRIPNLHELDWIVMKSLEKDRNRRYESASALAADMQRYLSDEPVLACPPSLGYRFRKFARRNKAPLATTAALMVGLLIAVAVLAISTARIGRALRAETQAMARERSNFYAYALGLARRDWLAGDLEHAKQNLRACPEGLRDQDWRYLDRVCHAELHQFNQVKNSGRILYSPDGKRIACAGLGNLAILTLVDAATGQEQFTSLAVSIADPALHFSSDGKQLIWAGVARGPLFAVNPAIKGKPNQFVVTIWNVAGPEQIASVSRECTGNGRVSLSPDGTRVALVDNKKATICDARSGQELFSLAGPMADVLAGPALPTGEQPLGTFGSGRTLRFWNGTTGQPTHSVPVPHNIRTLAFSPDGRLLVGATYESNRSPHAVSIWDGKTGAALATLTGHAGQVNLLAFSPDGKRLASAGSDNAIIVWDLERKCELLTFRGHKSPVVGLAFSPDGRRLASSSTDGTLRIWDATPGDETAGANATESLR